MPKTQARSLLSLSNLKVLVYAPNIIDYARFILLYVGYQYLNDPSYLSPGFSKETIGKLAPYKTYIFAAFYCTSYGLDAIDGHVARALHQTSKLGIYLDMVADRVSSCLLLHLAAQSVLKNHLKNLSLATMEMKTFEKFRAMDWSYFGLVLLCYLCLVFVEIVSHAVVMLKSELGGFHQKNMVSESWYVKLYLGNQKILFWSCALFELFGLGLFLDWPLFVVMLAFPAFMFRAIANVRRLLDVTVFAAPIKKKL